MRRKDRELSVQDGLAIIDASEYGTISCIADDGEIFSVPVSVVREGASLFLHGAPAGTKAKLLNGGKEATLVCVSYARVPVLAQERLDAIKDDGKALAAKVFTTEYKSAVAKVKAYLVTDEAARLHALRLLCEKYLRAKNRKHNGESKNHSGLNFAFMRRHRWVKFDLQAGVTASNLA